jgi:hypothetical protein
MIATWRLTGILMWLAASSLLLLPAGADAQKKKKDPGKAGEQYKAEDVLNDIITAYRLKEFGEKHKSPEALIAAGSLLRKAATAKLENIAEQPTIEDDKGNKVEASKEPAKSVSLADEADTIFAHALGLANELKLTGIDKLIQLAEKREYKQPGERAVIGGPQAIQRTINPGQTQVYHFKFQPQMPCAIGLRSSFPLQITVVRSDNNQVWVATTTTVGVHTHMPGPGPKKGIPVTVRVRSLAPQTGLYQLFVN